jgi:hypothetical protein
LTWHIPYVTDKVFPLNKIFCFLLVLQVDPDLARTVLVSTKLDTKIPQFARPSDVEVFLHPPTSVLDVSLLGDSPFFTSVPSGRVGSCHEAVFRSNEEFKKVPQASTTKILYLCASACELSSYILYRQLNMLEL